MRVPRHGTLYLDVSGTRWLVQGGERPRASAFGAGEALVALAQDGSHFAFLGRGGSVFLAEDLLGPFRAVRRAPLPVVDASAGGGVIIATARDGGLLRSNNWGRTWSQSELPGFVLASAMSDDGQALAVTLPETWHHSDDHGGTWHQLADVSLAPLSLFRNIEGAIQVTTPTGLRQWNGERFVAVKDGVTPERDWEPPPFARASTTQNHTAFLGERYFALESAESGFESLSGSLGKPLVRNAVEGLEDCANFRVAGRGRFVYVACVESEVKESSPPLRLFWSHDGGRAFRRIPLPLRGQLGRLRQTVSSTGLLAISGLCLAQAAEPGCDPEGLQVFGPGPRFRRTWRSLGVPGVPLPEALSFSSPERLWVAGRGKKDGSVVVASVRVPPIEPHGKSGARSASETDEPPSYPLRVETRTVLGAPERLPSLSQSAGRVQLLPGLLGGVVVLLAQRDEFFAVPLEREGNILGVGRLPDGIVAAHGHGGDLLAVDPSRQQVWESNDAGLSWQASPLPRPLCSDEKNCTVALACHASGCLVGDQLSRVGWGYRLEESASHSLSETRLRRSPIGISYSCRQEGEVRALGAVMHLPDSGDAVQGGTAWSQVVTDWNTGQVTALHVPIGSSEIERRTLLPPLRQPSDFALAVVPQVEGSAALRYRLPDPKQGRANISDVELAWDNRFHDSVGRARLPGEFPPFPGDYGDGPGELALAEPELISVAGSGIYLRLHHSAELAQKTYFVDSGGVEVVDPPHWPEEWKQFGDREMVRIGSTHAALMLTNGRRIVVRAMARPGKSHRLEPRLLGLLDPEQRGVGQAIGIAYTGLRPGFLSIQASLDQTTWFARYLPLGEDEAFLPVREMPLNLDLAEPPPSCSAEQRREWTRIEAPAFPARGHEVSVHRAGQETLEFQAGPSVIFGDGRRACLAALEASPSALSRQPGRPTQLLLFPEGEEFRGWLFSSEMSPSGTVEVEAHVLSCAAQ